MSEPSEILRALRRVRQIRQFTDEPLDASTVDAIVDVGRWSGSSQNSQPWRFIVIRDRTTLTRIGELGAPSTRALVSATAAIAVAMPADTDRAVSHAYDEGRAAERLLIAAELVALGAAIMWVPSRARPEVAGLLALPPELVVRSIIAMGHPAPEARAPKSPPGEARLPRGDTVFDEHWPPPDAPLDD